MSDALLTIASAKLKRYSAEIVRRLQSTCPGAYQPDDYPARHVWDLWKLEMQEEHSLSHDLLEQLIDLEIWGFVESLPWDEIAFLTLMLDPDLSEEEEVAAYNELVAQHVRSELNSCASDEPHCQEIQAMLDGYALDRFQRDIEGFERT